MLKPSKRGVIDVGCSSIAAACDRLGRKLGSALIFLGVCFLYTSICSYFLRRYRDSNVPVMFAVILLLLLYTCMVAVEGVLLLRCVLIFLSLERLRRQKSRIHKTSFSWGRGCKWLWAPPEGAVMQDGMVYSCLWVKVPLSRRLILEVNYAEAE